MREKLEGRTDGIFDLLWLYSDDKGPNSQGYDLSSGHIWLWKLDHKEGRAPKNRCLQTMVLEKTPESPLNNKEIKPVSLKGNQPWILAGRTDAKVEASVFWSSDVNSWLIGKVPDAGKDWGKKEKRESEDEMAGWLDGITDAKDMNLAKLWEMVRDREAFHAAVHGFAKSQTWLGDWKATNGCIHFLGLPKQVATNLLVKISEIHSVTVLEARCPKLRCWRGQILLWKLCKRMFSCLSSFWWLQASLDLWPHHFSLCITSVSVSIPTQPSLWFFSLWCPICVSLLRILVLGFRDNTDNPGWPHLESLNSICSITSC